METRDRSYDRKRTLNQLSLLAPSDPRFLLTSRAMVEALRSSSSAISRYELESAKSIKPNDTYRYPAFDDLKAAGPIMIDSLRLAFQATADELAKQF